LADVAVKVISDASDIDAAALNLRSYRRVNMQIIGKRASCCIQERRELGNACALAGSNESFVSSERLLRVCQSAYGSIYVNEVIDGRRARVEQIVVCRARQIRGRGRPNSKVSTLRESGAIA
jgi:hypothetical protein